MFLIRYLLWCLLLSEISAQPYINSPKTRHRFAQLLIGLESRYVAGTETLITERDSNGNKVERNLNSSTSNRIVIGGTHFWGKSDFFIAIPFFGSGSKVYAESAETGLRYYPLPVKFNAFRLFIGTSWQVFSFRYKNACELKGSRINLSGGITYAFEKYLLNLNTGYTLPRKFDYYSDKLHSDRLKLPTYHVSLGLKWMLETTLSAEKSFLNGKSKYLSDSLGKHGELNGLTLAAGPSSAFFTRSASHNKDRPWLGKHYNCSVFPEFSIGYYLHKPDLQFNLVYRNIVSRQSAFGVEQISTRKAFSLEGFKFFADYHGFAAFAGPVISYDMMVLSEHQLNQTGTSNIWRLNPGICFGWDIRPNRLQAFYLRTALRYFPCIKLKNKSGGIFRFDMLEFNFIQLVIFPSRL